MSVQLKENPLVFPSFKTHFVRGYDALLELTNKLEPERAKGSKILVYLTGEKLATGESWCPDCVKAEPHIESYLKKNEKNVTIGHLIVVDVGDRAYWKDPTNSFRKNLNVHGIPTIMRWKGQQKLAGDELCDHSLLPLLFEDQEDY